MEKVAYNLGAYDCAGSRGRAVHGEHIDAICDQQAPTGLDIEVDDATKVERFLGGFAAA
jgi:hypothetical protein